MLDGIECLLMATKNPITMEYLLVFTFYEYCNANSFFEIAQWNRISMCHECWRNYSVRRWNGWMKSCCVYWDWFIFMELLEHLLFVYGLYHRNELEKMRRFSHWEWFHNGNESIVSSVLSLEFELNAVKKPFWFTPAKIVECVAKFAKRL